MEPAHVLISGAAGQIGYILSHWVADGSLYDERPIILHLYDIKPQESKLKALAMELQDCSFPKLHKIIATLDPKEAFSDIDCAIFVSSVKLLPGQIRYDLLKGNVTIFRDAGHFLSDYAKPTCKIVVVANPDNTMCQIAIDHCKNIPKENFTSLSLLDHNRCIHQLAAKIGCEYSQVKNVVVWGNHGETMVADYNSAWIERDGKKTPVKEIINDEKYRTDEFFTIIRRRGFDVLHLRGDSSAGSAARCAVQQMRALLYGTAPGEVISLGIPVPDDEPYGIKKGVVFSYPCTVDKNGKVHVVKDYKIDEWLQSKIDITHNDLFKEKDEAKKLLGEN